MDEDPHALAKRDEEFAARLLGVPGSSDMTRSDSENSIANCEILDFPANKSRSWSQEREVIEELKASEVRWFYRDSSKKRWAPFIGFDSLRIECMYKEVNSGCGVINSKNVERISVLGDLYEVNVVSKEYSPIYWQAEPGEITRGTWFYDSTWQPVEEEYATVIESDHLSMFQNQELKFEQTTPTKGRKSIIFNRKFKDFHVDWNSPFEIFMFSESTSFKLIRTVGKAVGIPKSGIRLHRGYCEEARPDDKSPVITHIVFVVHGIGQKMDQTKIIRNCSSFRKIAHKQMKLHFPGVLLDDKTAEFLPVEWRSSLKLDDGTVESITPRGLRTLRDLLNSTAMDIMYYSSPKFRTEIVHGVQDKLHRLYDMFCERHPYFQTSGKVSIVAHSLGSVITYDIITGWNPMTLYGQYVNDTLDKCISELNSNHSAAAYSELVELRKRARDLETQLISSNGQPGLKFKVENLFTIGSPLSVFLALRGLKSKDIGSIEHLLPKNRCSRLFNVFHRSDPVAYRIEPLILKHYETIAPVSVHRADVRKLQTYDDIKTELITAKNLSDKEMMYVALPLTPSDSNSNCAAASPGSQAASYTSHLTSLWSRWTARNPGNVNQEMSDLENIKPSSPEPEVKLPDDFIESNELEDRIDYVLREGTIGSQYLSAVTSHTSYWFSHDVALFVLTHIFHQNKTDEAKASGQST